MATQPTNTSPLYAAPKPLYASADEWLSHVDPSVSAEVVKSWRELVLMQSKRQSAAEKLLVEQEANKYDAAAKASQAISELKKARASGNSDAMRVAGDILIKQMDVLAETDYKVASREFAPLLVKANNARAASPSNPNYSYWRAIATDMLTAAESPAGKGYLDNFMALATTGRDWRKELASEGYGEGDPVYTNMLDLEKQAEALKQSRGDFREYLKSTIGFIDGGDAQSAVELRAPWEDPKLAGFMNTLDMGMDVDTLKAKAADLRSTATDDQLSKSIAFLEGMMGKSPSGGESPNYVNALKNEQYQAWAADRGLTIGQVTLDDAGNVVSVVKGKDDMRAARMYTNQMQRDPLAAQRRYRASKDVVRAEWTQGDQAAEELRDPSDNVMKSVITFKDTEDKPHTVFVYQSKGKTERYFDLNSGAETTMDKMAAIRKSGTTPVLATEGEVLTDNGKLLSSSAMSGDISKLTLAGTTDAKDATALFEKENSEKKAGKAGSPQFVDGIDLGIHARNGERVLLTAEGKRITVPKDAKVTKLDSLSPESAHTFDKLRAGRVNRGIANTDALSTQQKDDALGGLDEMSLAEKRAEAQRVKAEQEKAANEKVTEATMPVVRKGDQADESGAVARDYDAYPGWREDDAAIDKANFLVAEGENKVASPMSTDFETNPGLTPAATFKPMQRTVDDMEISGSGTTNSLDNRVKANPTNPRTVVVAKHDLAKRMRPYLSQSALTSMPSSGDKESATKLSLRLGKRGEINAAARQKDIEKNEAKRKKENEETLRKAQMTMENLVEKQRADSTPRISSGPQPAP